MGRSGYLYPAGVLTPEQIRGISPMSQELDNLSGYLIHSNTSQGCLGNGAALCVLKFSSGGVSASPRRGIPLRKLRFT
jgi:hypothetical protein